MWYHEYNRNVEIVIHVKHAREENEGKCRTTKAKQRDCRREVRNRI